MSEAAPVVFRAAVGDSFEMFSGHLYTVVGITEDEIYVTDCYGDTHPSSHQAFYEMVDGALECGNAVYLTARRSGIGCTAVARTAASSQAHAA
jgi:hypothetical protein